MTEGTLTELRNEAQSWERVAERARRAIPLKRATSQAQQLFDLKETKAQATANANAIRKVIALGSPQ